MRIGIDLGTTNSLASIWTPEGPRLIPNALGEFLTPSAVSIEGAESFVVGRAALERQAVDPANTATSFKRFMGTNHRIRLSGRDYAPGPGYARAD